MKISFRITELRVYLLIWIGSVFYAIYCFAQKSHECMAQNNEKYSKFINDSDFQDFPYSNSADFTSGWQFLQRKKDKSDYEWDSIIFFIPKAFLWMIALLIVSEILRIKKLFKILKLWQILIGITFLFYNYEIISLELMLFQPVIYLIVSKIIKTTLLIWVCNGFVLYTIHSSQTILITSGLFHDEREFYLIWIQLFWMNLKCISYSIDVVEKREQYDIVAFLSYCLYLPVFTFGPFLGYSDFKKCYTNSTTLRPRISDLIGNLLRLVVWMGFAEFVLHYIYVNVAMFYPDWVETLDTWSLYGYGYAMGQFFHIKYVVLYGFTTNFAKFDQVQVPPLPKCIGRIHLYSDMWKYFDVGLYKFLLRYIYIPIMKNSQFIQNKFVASFLCFAFIYVWHGIENYILIWTVLNFIGIIMEEVSKTLYESYLKKIGFIRNLRPEWVRRVTCLFASPLLAMSCISNFYFFAHSNIGLIFVDRLINDSFLATVILMLILYCCCQVSTELRINDSKKQK